MSADQNKTSFDKFMSKTPTFKTSSHSNTAIGTSLLAQVSTLAWNLVIPIVGGVLLGNYLDKRGEHGVTWTLSLLVLGVVIAFSNLYNLYIDNRNEDSDENDADRGHYAGEE